MHTSKELRKAILVSGLALFAMFLGAGNIIFPPFIGAVSGAKWSISTLGFVITAIGLPLLGVLAVAQAGGTADSISQRVHPVFAKVLNTMILMMIGPIFALPRTAATTCELSFLPYFKDVAEYKTVLLIGGTIFFILATGFALSEGKTLDLIGKYLTPILAFFLFTIIVMAVFEPIGTPGKTVEDTRSLFVEGATIPASTNGRLFLFGFTTGYQTMDGMASIVLGSGVVLALLSKGFSKKECKKMLKYVGLIAGFGLSCVYVGFNYLGACGSDVGLQDIDKKTQLTVSALEKLSGPVGRLMLAGVIFFACLTTATGLMDIAANYFKELFKNKLSYKAWVLIISFIGFLISQRGVEGIISIAAPILEFVYPIIIILIVLNLFNDKIKYDWVFKGAVIGGGVTSFFMVIKVIKEMEEFSNRIIEMIPLGAQGFAYIIPAIMGGLMGAIYEYRLKSKQMERERIKT